MRYIILTAISFGLVAVLAALPVTAQEEDKLRTEAVDKKGQSG